MDHNEEEQVDLNYQEVICPENYYLNFKSKEEFITYLEQGSQKDLESVLERYTQVEMYDQCEIIKQFINQKFKN